MTIAAFVAYMVAVHVPLLYTHRYSVGALDFPLALLAAMGLVEISRSARHAAVALWRSRWPWAPGSSTRAPQRLSRPRPSAFRTRSCGSPISGARPPIAPGIPIDIAITKDANSPPWDLSMLQLDLAASAMKPGTCTAIRVRFRKAAEDRFADWRVVRVPIVADGAVHRYTVGSTVPLALDGAGTLRLEPECNSAATLRVGAVAVIAPRREAYYRDRYLKIR